MYGVPIPFVRVLGFLLWFWFGSFLVLDDAICVVGECGFSQCTVPRSTVPFPMTPPYVGRDVIFFLLKLFFTHDSRTLPGFALPGVSTTLLFGDQLAVCDVRLRTAPRETAIPLAQWTSRGYAPTRISAAGRVHVASARAALPPERKRERARFGLHLLAHMRK